MCLVHKSKLADIEESFLIRTDQNMAHFNYLVNQADTVKKREKLRSAYGITGEAPLLAGHPVQIFKITPFDIFHAELIGRSLMHPLPPSNWTFYIILVVLTPLHLS